jgi:hypothetical protein
MERERVVFYAAKQIAAVCRRSSSAVEEDAAVSVACRSFGIKPSEGVVAVAEECVQVAG